MVVTRQRGFHHNTPRKELWSRYALKKFIEVILRLPMGLQQNIFIQFLSMKTKHQIATVLFQKLENNPEFITGTISQYLDLYLMDDGLTFSFLKKQPYSDPTPITTSHKIPYKEFKIASHLAHLCRAYNLRFRKIIIMTNPLNIFIKWYLPFTVNVKIAWHTNFEIYYINHISDDVWEKVSTMEFTKWDANNGIKKSITYKFKKNSKETTKSSILLEIPYSIKVTISEYENRHESFELSMFTKNVRYPVTLKEMDSILSFYNFLSVNNIVPVRGLEERVYDMIPFHHCIKHLKCDFLLPVNFPRYKNLRALTLVEPSFQEFNKLFTIPHLRYIEVVLYQKKFDFNVMLLPNLKSLTLKFMTFPEHYLLDLTLSELEYLRVLALREEPSLQLTLVPLTLAIVILCFSKQLSVYRIHYKDEMEKLRPMVKFEKNPHFSRFLTV